MTNFEKWKEGLNANNTAYIGEALATLDEGHCTFCPARHYELIMEYGITCSECWEEWANAPMEEETNDEF